MYQEKKLKITLTFSLPDPELSCGLMLSFCPNFPASDLIVCFMSFRDCILPEMFISGSLTDGRDLLSSSFPVSAKLVKMEKYSAAVVYIKSITMSVTMIPHPIIYSFALNLYEGE